MAALFYMLKPRPSLIISLLATPKVMIEVLIFVGFGGLKALKTIFRPLLMIAFVIAMLVVMQLDIKEKQHMAIQKKTVDESSVIYSDTGSEPASKIKAIRMKKSIKPSEKAMVKKDNALNSPIH